MEEKKNKSPAASHGRTCRVIWAAIMGLIVIIFLGYLMTWIMLPTSTYLDQWRTKILADTNSSYFGAQGETILIFTFPMLLIAVLGSVYLQLGMKLGHNSNMKRKKYVLNSWKRPVIIKGLGIVSWTEICFLVMFIALLVWTFASFFHFFASFTKDLAAKGDKMWEAKVGTIALILGIVGNVGLTFLFFPVSRGSSVLPLFGLTSESSIKYHIWLGHITMFLFTAHGLFYIVYWALTDRISEVLKWDKTQVSNVAGELSLLFGLILWVTTYPSIRRKMFELFFYTHYLYIFFMIFFVLHLGISYSFYMLPGFYLFMVDRYLRFLQSTQRVRLVSARVLPCETVELNFSKSKGLSYTPTSIMFINVPSISKLQWHPFTINSSSNLEPEILSVLIKSEGSWTKKLYQMLASPSSIDHLDVSVEGPYGPASTEFLRHDELVMVSGGSGISPFISIIRDLIYMNSTMKCKTPNIHLISAFKYSSEISMLDLILPFLDAPHEITNLDLQIEAHVTREIEPPSENLKPLQTIWFKPKTSDTPISPTLGKFSWLWLSAIISLSFVIFLVFMGILTRFYIYPIDHNTYQVYSNSLKSVLYMLLMCVSIVMTASAAFLWNKKLGSMESKKIQEISSSIGELELESLPQESLVKATKVHYGQRPDLKRILLEHKGTSVGVLVCGPKSMRHDVANICSSGLAENLHFESISFNW